MLRTRNERPHSRRTSNNLDELASPHCRPQPSDKASYRFRLTRRKGRMSALGQKQTFAAHKPMSALPQKRTCAVQ
jgi:hypothetical protein